MRHLRGELDAPPNHWYRLQLDKKRNATVYYHNNLSHIDELVGVYPNVYLVDVLALAPEGWGGPKIADFRIGSVFGVQRLWRSGKKVVVCTTRGRT